LAYGIPLTECWARAYHSSRKKKTLHKSHTKGYIQPQNFEEESLIIQLNIKFNVSTHVKTPVHDHKLFPLSSFRQTSSRSAIIHRTFKIPKFFFT